MSNPRDSGIGELRQSVSLEAVSPSKRVRTLSGDPCPVLHHEENSSSTSSGSLNTSSSGGSDSGCVHSFASVAEEMAPPVTIKTNVELPVYSGHPPNTKYNGRDGPCTELQKVQDWLSEIHRIGKAGGWSSETIATQAAMKLVPQSPAHNWLKVVEQSNGAPLIVKLRK